MPSSPKICARDALSLMSVLQRGGQWDWRQGRQAAAPCSIWSTRRTPDRRCWSSPSSPTPSAIWTARSTSVGVARLPVRPAVLADPTQLAWRFSPESNGVRNQVRPDDELRVLVATDVLSEGQNLQDGAIVINYDLPWAIMRLIQRAGRVDRIGQQAENILCYSFLPADGVERILRLRARVRQRLQENAEVVGTDEAFFEDRPEQSGRGRSVQRESRHPGRRRRQRSRPGLLCLPDLEERHRPTTLFAADRSPTCRQWLSRPKRTWQPRSRRTGPGVPAHRGWQRRAGLGGRAGAQRDRIAVRDPEAPPSARRIPLRCRMRRTITSWWRRRWNWCKTQERVTGGQLGGHRARASAPTRGSNALSTRTRARCLITQELLKAVDEIYRYPLRETARDILNRQLRAGIERSAAGRSGGQPSRRRPAVHRGRRQRAARSADYLQLGLVLPGR